MHVVVDTLGKISGVSGFSRSGDDKNNRGSRYRRDGCRRKHIVQCGAWPLRAALAKLVAPTPPRPPDWASFVEHIGGWTGTFDLPSLKSDPHGVLFHSGMFDPTKVTPVIYAEDSGPSQDYANADVYATVPGDANLDGKVDFSDSYSFWRSTMEWRMSARSAVTLGATGTADFNDLLVLAQHYGIWRPKPGGRRGRSRAFLRHNDRSRDRRAPGRAQAKAPFWSTGCRGSDAISDSYRRCGSASTRGLPALTAAKRQNPCRIARWGTPPAPRTHTDRLKKFTRSYRLSLT